MKLDKSHIQIKDNVAVNKMVINEIIANCWITIISLIIKEPKPILVVVIMSNIGIIFFLIATSKDFVSKIVKYM